MDLCPKWNVSFSVQIYQTLFPISAIFFLFQARNRTLKCFEARDTLANAVLGFLISGDDPVNFDSLFLNLTVRKLLLEDLGGSAVSNSETRFGLPSLEEMNMTFGANGTEKYSSVGAQVGVSLLTRI